MIYFRSTIVILSKTCRLNAYEMNALHIFWPHFLTGQNFDWRFFFVLDAVPTLYTVFDCCQGFFSKGT